jgi:hypothetical protein
MRRECRQCLALRGRCLYPAQTVNSREQFSLRGDALISQDARLERGVERTRSLAQR